MKTSKHTYWAINRHKKTATLLHGFIDFEHVQGCFRAGILMPDGAPANGIGRSISVKDFERRATTSGYTVL
jgi:hypothetical protein